MITLYLLTDSTMDRWLVNAIQKSEMDSKIYV